MFGVAGVFRVCAKEEEATLTTDIHAKQIVVQVFYLSEFLVAS